MPGDTRKPDWKSGFFFLLLGMVVCYFSSRIGLGPMLEDALRQSLIMSEGDARIFFTRPISGVLMGAAVLLLGSSMFSQIRKKRMALPLEEEFK